MDRKADGPRETEGKMDINADGPRETEGKMDRNRGCDRYKHSWTARSRKF